MRKNKAIGPILMSIFILFSLYMFFIYKDNYCPVYYKRYKLEYEGIVSRKWRDKGYNIYINYNNEYDCLWEGDSKELVNNAEVGDTVIKKGSSMICTLKTKNKTMIMPYYYIPRGCNCPDTNKQK
jgi:hypothetical protein